MSVVEWDTSLSEEVGEINKCGINEGKDDGTHESMLNLLTSRELVAVRDDKVLWGCSSTDSRQTDTPNRSGSMTVTLLSSILGFYLFGFSARIRPTWHPKA